MLVKLKKSELEKDFILGDGNNLIISSQELELSLHIKEASIIMNRVNLKLTIIANITVVIDYSSSEQKNNTNSSLKYDLADDYQKLKSFITVSQLKQWFRNRF